MKIDHNVLKPPSQNLDAHSSSGLYEWGDIEKRHVYVSDDVGSKLLSPRIIGNKASTLTNDGHGKSNWDDSSILPVRKRSKSFSARNPITVLLISIIWYFFSATSTFINKILVKDYNTGAQELTFVHLMLGTFFDALILWTPKKSKLNKSRFQPVAWNKIWKIVPLSACAVVTKLLTYYSYGQVPVSVTHTAKALGPFFSVILSYIVYHQKFHLSVYVSLIPIVLGVVLATSTEFHLNSFASAGIMNSILAAFIGVVERMYAKYLLRHSIIADSINLHFYNGLMSVLLNVPSFIFNYNGLLFKSVPIHLLLSCSILQFLGSFASVILLGKLSELTYSVVSTMKRVVIIYAAILYFGNPVTFQSILGTLLATSGIVLYQWMKHYPTSHSS